MSRCPDQNDLFDFSIDVVGRFDILMSRVFVHTSYLYVGGGS
jgi:hypothetical protein